MDDVGFASDDELAGGVKVRGHTFTCKSVYFNSQRVKCVTSRIA